MSSNGPDDRRDDDQQGWGAPPPPGGDAPPPGGPPPPPPSDPWGQPAPPSTPPDPSWGQQPQGGGWGQPGYGAPPGYGVPPPDGGLVENAVRVVTSPVDTLRRLTHHPRTAWAVVVVAIIGALGFVSGAAGMDTSAAPGDPFAPGPDLGALRGAMIVGGLILGPIVAVLSIVVWTAILHGMARLFKGTGTFAGTFSGVSFAYVPSVLSVPFQLLPLVRGLAGSLLASAVGFAVFVWVLVLDVIAVRECHHLSTGRAVGAVLIPIAVFFVLIVVLVVLVLALVLGGLAGMA